MTSPMPMRARARQQLRTVVLDAAYALLLDGSWESLRMADVARAAGTSRQTVHNEFRTKTGLGEALVLRETERFVSAVADRLQAAEDPVSAVRDAVSYTLSEAAADPVLKAVLVSARGGDEGLLPLLTTRSEPVLHLASDVVQQQLRLRLPDASPEDVASVVDAVVRLAVSHIVLPLDPVDVTSDRIAELVRRFLLAGPTPR